MSKAAHEAGVTLRLESVGRTYGVGAHALSVLDNANIAVRAGEMVALVAPSGAGKSTLLHAAGLLERPDRGEVYIDGLATRELDDKRRTALRRSSIGFVYQFHHLLPEFSAAENLMIPQMLRGVAKPLARTRAHELLEYMRMGERHDHRPSELSGGEQQRVAIARAVANNPRLLLADEPTGNLDPETAAHVFSMLDDLVRTTGLAALIATHNHDLAARMDRCVTLNAGQILEVKE